MANLVVEVNPVVRFSDEQITAILDEVFRTYGEFIDTGGLTLEGLARTYEDGAGDVDRDFDALGLALPEETATPLGVSPGSEGSSKGPSTMNLSAQEQKAVGGLSADVAALLAELDMLLSNATDETPEEVLALAKAIDALRHRADTMRTADESFDAHMEMGYVLGTHGRHDEALRSYRRAIVLRPEEARAHFRAGNALYSLGRFPEACTEYDRSLGVARQPQDDTLLPKIHVNLGIALEGDGMLMSACEHYREAAILNPSHFRALKLLGSALLGLGELQASEEALEHALHLHADFADAQCDLGCAMTGLGNEAGALAAFQRAVELDGRHVEALYNIGNLQRNAGEFRLAVDSYDRCLAEDPFHWRALMNKGVALTAMSETGTAIACFEEAFELTGRRIELYDTIKSLKRLARSKSSWGMMRAAPAEGRALLFARKKGKIGRMDHKALASYGIENLSQTLDVATLQRLTKLRECPVEDVLSEKSDSNIPAGADGKNVRKAMAERILKRLLKFSSPATFQSVMKAVNERILSKLDRHGRGLVNIGQFLAVLTAICRGTNDERKAAMFEILQWTYDQTGATLPKSEARYFLDMIKAIFRDLPLPDAPTAGSDETVNLDGFSVMIDDAKDGLAMLSVIPNVTRRKGWSLF